MLDFVPIVRGTRIGNAGAPTSLRGNGGQYARIIQKTKKLGFFFHTIMLDRGPFDGAKTDCSGSVIAKGD